MRIDKITVNSPRRWNLCKFFLSLLKLSSLKNCKNLLLDKRFLTCLIKFLQRLLIVPPELAYGNKGVQEIPPNATIEVSNLSSPLVL